MDHLAPVRFVRWIGSHLRRALGPVKADRGAELGPAAPYMWWGARRGARRSDPGPPRADEGRGRTDQARD
jgi:hypothetical protein